VAASGEQGKEPPTANLVAFLCIPIEMQIQGGEKLLTFGSVRTKEVLYHLPNTFRDSSSSSSSSSIQQAAGCHLIWLFHREHLIEATSCCTSLEINK
jgi:hypothetical protein